MDYQIKLPVFEGPFDLLLHLIRANRVDIYDIPVAEITAQYLEYLHAMEELDLEIASSFLVMAATLLAIKARLLLPAPPAEEGRAEEFEDARGELVRDLLEYLRFKQAASGMASLREISGKRIARPNEQELYVNMFSGENPLEGKTLADLEQAFRLVLAKTAPREAVLSIERESVTLRDRLARLFEVISSHPDGVAFSAAFAGCAGRLEMIVTFLALLELIRQGVARFNQSGEYGEIYLYPGELSNYDQNAAL